VYGRLAAQREGAILVFLNLPDDAPRLRRPGKRGTSGKGHSINGAGCHHDEALRAGCAVRIRPRGALPATSPGRRFAPCRPSREIGRRVAALVARLEVERIDLYEAVASTGGGGAASSGRCGAGSRIHGSGGDGRAPRLGIDTHHPDLGTTCGAACFCSKATGCLPNGTTTQFGTARPRRLRARIGRRGVITSNGVVSRNGVAPQAKLVLVKVVDSTGLFCCSSDVIAGLDWINANAPT